MIFKGLFDNVNHEWKMRMLGHDIVDRKFLEVIEKFLKAGVMENGNYLESDHGTPQGNGASHIYLHYVLDNWFDVIEKRQCKGECYLIRYCDDFVCCYQSRYEAEVFKLENVSFVRTQNKGEFVLQIRCEYKMKSRMR